MIGVYYLQRKKKSRLSCAVTLLFWGVTELGYAYLGQRLKKTWGHEKMKKLKPKPNSVCCVFLSFFFIPLAVDVGFKNTNLCASFL